MAKFTVTASEVVYYLKTIEAKSEEDLRRMIDKGSISFDNEDICDGWDFQITEIIQND